MFPVPLIESPQATLLHIVADDDRVLLESPDTEWYRILYGFPWEKYCTFAAQYYDALYRFNLEEAKKRQAKAMEQKTAEEAESREHARQRLLFERATMQSAEQASVPIIFPGKVIDLEQPGIHPETISPGVVPDRFGGKKPKCFFALLKSFIGASLIGFPPEPQSVYLLLTSNPSFVRVCGFAPKHEQDGYCYQHTPSLGCSVCIGL